MIRNLAVWLRLAANLIKKNASLNESNKQKPMGFGFIAIVTLLVRYQAIESWYLYC